ncbi:neprilysin-11-like [Planococcus citri]|uniref:neprilysin-11-like n=1 Tax=Planococcus citri TaxID=170843 RepID=UPI0031F89BA7
MNKAANTCASNNTMYPLSNILHTLGISMLRNESETDYTTMLARASKLVGIDMYFSLGTSSNPHNRTENMIVLTYPENESKAKNTILHPSSIASRPRTVVGKITDHQFIDRMKRSTSPELDKMDNNKTTEQHEQMRNKSSTAFTILYTLKQLQDLTDGIAIEANTTIPQLNWTRYIEELYTGLDNVTLDLNDPTKVKISIYDLDYIQKVIHLIYEMQSVKKIVDKLRKKVVGLISHLEYCVYPYFSYNYKHTITIPTELHCVKKTIESLDMAVSYVYTTKKKYRKAKIIVGEMFVRIRDSLEQIMQKAEWLDDKTKIRALKKLQSMKARIAYPDMIESPHELNYLYKNVQLYNTFYDTVISRIQRDRKSNLNRLNQINDLSIDDWNDKSPSAVNSFYDILKNTMTIPAGILGSPMYSNSLKALDYGGIGSFIGHEITHAFDNTGRHYNEIGIFENWWTEETSKIYDEKAKCFVEAYENYSTSTGNVAQKHDSKETLGEDISDNGGFKEALYAYKKYISEYGDEPILPLFENFTHEQLFTLSFANAWCENPTMDSAEASQFDEHSPKGVRVNGVLSNSKEFPEIWKCPKGSRMNPNKEKCSIW